MRRRLDHIINGKESQYLPKARMAEAGRDDNLSCVL